MLMQQPLTLRKINAIRGSLPDGIDEPVVIKRDVNATPIMYVAVQSSHSLDDIYSKTENDFQDVLQQADGVSEIELNGGVIRKSPSKSTRTSSSTTI